MLDVRLDLKQYMMILLIFSLIPGIKELELNVISMPWDNNPLILLLIPEEWWHTFPVF